MVFMERHRILFFFFVLPHSAKESLTEGAILKKVGRGPLLY